VVCGAGDGAWLEPVQPLGCGGWGGRRLSSAAGPSIPPAHSAIEVPISHRHLSLGRIASTPMQGAEDGWEWGGVGGWMLGGS
jgi:hypothetical protein